MTAPALAILEAAPRISAPVFGAVQSGSWGGLVPWLLILGLAGLGACVVLLVRVARAHEAQADGLRYQGTQLGELRELVGQLAHERGDLDLRRVEHVLIDLRDAQGRLEDALLRSVQRPHEGPPPAIELPAADVADRLFERLTNRVLAMGFERVQIVTPRDDFEEFGDAREDVALEARRDGVLFKGRATVQSGRVIDVDMKPLYSLFP